MTEKPDEFERWILKYRDGLKCDETCANNPVSCAQEKRIIVSLNKVLEIYRTLRPKILKQENVNWLESEEIRLTKVIKSYNGLPLTELTGYCGYLVGLVAAHKYVKAKIYKLQGVGKTARIKKLMGKWSRMTGKMIKIELDETVRREKAEREFYEVLKKFMETDAGKKIYVEWLASKGLRMMDSKLEEKED